MFFAFWSLKRRSQENLDAVRFQQIISVAQTFQGIAKRDDDTTG